MWQMVALNPLHSKSCMICFLWLFGDIVATDEIAILGSFLGVLHARTQLWLQLIWCANYPLKKGYSITAEVCQTWWRVLRHCYLEIPPGYHIGNIYRHIWFSSGDSVCERGGRETNLCHPCDNMQLLKNMSTWQVCASFEANMWRWDTDWLGDVFCHKGDKWFINLY